MARLLPSDDEAWVFNQLRLAAGELGITDAVTAAAGMAAPIYVPPWPRVKNSAEVPGTTRPAREGDPYAVLVPGFGASDEEVVPTLYGEPGLGAALRVLNPTALFGVGTWSSGRPSRRPGGWPRTWRRAGRLEELAASSASLRPDPRQVGSRSLSRASA